MKTGIKINIIDICAFYILAWTITPAFESGIVYRILLIGCTLIWFLSKINFIRQYSNMLVGIVFFLVVNLVMQSLNIGLSSAVSHTINMAIYGIVAFIGLYYYQSEERTARIFIGFMLFITIIVAIISIKTVIENPTALRIATHEWKSGSVNYGSYSFVYMCVQLIPFLLLFMLYRVFSEKITRLLCTGSLIVGLILAVLSGFTLANIICFGGIILCVVMFKPNIKKTLFFITFAVVLLFIYKPLMSWALSSLVEITKNSPMYAAKVRQVYNQFVLGEGVGSTYSDRVNLYLTSWSTVFRYPIIGSILLTGKSITGGHSTLVDALAGGGLLYALPMYWLMIIHPLNVVKNELYLSQNRVTINVVFLFVVLLTGIFDTLTYSNAWVWFLLVPFLSKQISESGAEMVEE